MLCKEKPVAGSKRGVSVLAACGEEGRKFVPCIICAADVLHNVGNVMACRDLCEGHS
jgi:hypothetical protein